MTRLKSTGVGVLDIEVIRLGADFSVAECLRLLEVGAKLGARAILVAGDDDEETRLTTSFAALSQAAQLFGLSANLEFMPWTRVPNAVGALRVVRNAAHPNGAVLVDALHYSRSVTSISDIACDSKMLNYAQICDAPANANCECPCSPAKSYGMASEQIGVPEAAY
jgi:sugar phosphate isomerase/epimerase